MSARILGGRASALEIERAGAAMVAELAMRMEPCPLPCWLMLNSVGVATAMVSGPVTPVIPGCTYTEAGPDVLEPKGICKLIWFGETKYSGTPLPLNNMVTPPIVIGRGNALACTSEPARFAPYSDISAPGDPVAIFEDAALPMPPLPTTGPGPMTQLPGPEAPPP